MNKYQKKKSRWARRYVRLAKRCHGIDISYKEAKRRFWHCLLLRDVKILPASDGYTSKIIIIDEAPYLGKIQIGKEEKNAE